MLPHLITASSSKNVNSGYLLTLMMFQTHMLFCLQWTTKDDF